MRLASGRRSYAASPSALTVGPDGDNRFTLSAPAGFRGPGSVLVEVTTATDASGNEDATHDRGRRHRLLSIPVLVGRRHPVARVPHDRHPDLGRPALRPRHRHATARSSPSTPATPRASTSPPSGARPSTASTSAAPRARSSPITASDDRHARAARPCCRARRRQQHRRRSASGSPRRRRRRCSPIKVETMEAGQSRTYDIARLPRGRRRQPRSQRSCRCRTPATPGVRASVDGSRLTLTADRDTRGVEASFRLVVSDVSDGDPPSSRRAEGRIQFQVIGTPSPPGEPRPYPLSDEVGTIKMAWAPPDDDGGAPILYYLVREEKTGDQAAVRHQRVRLPQAEDRRQLQLPGAGGQPRGRAASGATCRGRPRPTPQPGRVQNIRMIGPRRRADHRRLGQAADQHLEDPRLHDHLARQAAAVVVAGDARRPTRDRA